MNTRGSTGEGRPAFDDDFHQMIVDNLADGVYYVDRERRITYWNRGAERISGYAADAMVGRRCYDDILAHVDAAGRQLCREGCPLAATLADAGVREAEVWLRHRDGHRVPVRVRVAPVRAADGTVVGAVEAFDDATRLQEARGRARAAAHDALTDELTGLPNRRHFDAALAGRLENFARYGWPFALLIADIDHFKQINDAYGHVAGDAVLRVVAATIAGGVRSGDHVARWGGEEFVVLAEGCSAATARSDAERVRRLVASATVTTDLGPIGASISVGATLAVSGDTPERIFERADRALYRAKNGGRDRVEVLEAEP